MNGVIVVDKPAGWTSHDVVAKVKRTLNARKVGHLGTLDPAATGVLPLVINGATRYARFLDVGGKGYAAVARLGEETDTQDGEGEVLKSVAVSDFKLFEIEQALGAFVGSIEQVPPMYSSVKRGGVPLYKLARKGITVKRPAKVVEIESIEVTGVELPYVSFNVECSRGTYIRTLSADFGARLGCGAHLHRLRRTRSGTFTGAEAVEADSSKEVLEAALIPLEVALNRAAPLMTGVVLDDTKAARLAKGLLSLDTEHQFKKGETVRLMHGAVVLAFAVYERRDAVTGSVEFDVVKLLPGGTVRLGAADGVGLEPGRVSGA